MSRILINVQAYSDFDIPTSRVIMEAPGFIDGGAGVRRIVKIVEDENRASNDVDAVIKQLKSLGFTVCKTVDLTIGGDL